MFILLLPTGPSIPLASYRGSPNETLDAPITEAEVRSALLLIRPGSAPGADGVINKLLRNLDGPSITALTAYSEYYWA